MKKIFLFSLFFNFTPFFMSAHLNHKAQETLEQLVGPITIGIDNHFEEYLATSCRNAENCVRPSQDCDDYLTFKTYAIVREVEESLQHLNQEIAKEGVSESQRKKFNKEVQEILLRKVLHKTEALHKIVVNDRFAETHMDDISYVALNISGGIKHPVYNRAILKSYFQRQSQRILDENKKNKIKELKGFL